MMGNPLQDAAEIEGGEQEMARALESIEVMPDGEIRARWARTIVGAEGAEESMWHRACYREGDAMPADVVAALQSGEIEGGSVTHHEVAAMNPAARFLARRGQQDR